MSMRMRQYSSNKKKRFLVVEDKNLAPKKYKALEIRIE